MININFRINFEVKLKRKLEKFLERYAKEIGATLDNLKIDRYWKIESQFQAEFQIALGDVAKADAVYKTLTLANTLQSGCWFVNGPHESKPLIFECILNNENDDQPLKWAHLALESKT